MYFGSILIVTAYYYSRMITFGQYYAARNGQKVEISRIFEVEFF